MRLCRKCYHPSVYRNGLCRLCLSGFTEEADSRLRGDEEKKLLDEDNSKNDSEGKNLD